MGEVGGVVEAEPEGDGKVFVGVEGPEVVGGVVERGPGLFFRDFERGLGGEGVEDGLVFGLLLEEEAALLIDELFDEVGGGFVAVVGEDGEGGGDFEGSGLEVAAREFVAFGEGAVDAKAFGEAGDFASGQLARGLDGLAGDGEAAAFGREGVEKGLEDGAKLAAGIEGAVEL